MTCLQPASNRQKTASWLNRSVGSLIEATCTPIRPEEFQFSASLQSGGRPSMARTIRAPRSSRSQRYRAPIRHASPVRTWMPYSARSCQQVMRRRVIVSSSDGVDRRQADALELVPDVGAGLGRARVARQRAELPVDLLE